MNDPSMTQNQRALLSRLPLYDVSCSDCGLNVITQFHPQMCQKCGSYRLVVVPSTDTVQTR